jgi:predicted TIM-barrel fold metal-dependent hydrolase
MSNPEQNRQIIISTDGHAGADLWDYKPYLESRYHEEFNDWATQFSDPWGQVAGASKQGQNIGFASFDVPVNWDSEARLSLLDKLGITAEVLFPNTAPPFLPSGAVSAPPPRSSKEYEYRFAGVQAHNRWLADFCAAANGRRGGFAQVFVNDIDAAISEVRWAKEAGLMGVLLPSDHELGLVNFYEPRFDPLWAACVELDMPIHRHQVFPAQTVAEGGLAAPWIGMLQIPFFARRAVAQFLCSAIFERFPDLKLVFTELSESVSLTPYVAELDEWYEVGLTPAADPGTRSHMVHPAAVALKRPPSAYFASNCYIAAPLDVKESLAAGTHNLMFGADLPHSEGPGEHTPEAIRTLVQGMTQDEADDFLYRRAATIYDFDLPGLQLVANQIGPSRTEVREPLAAGEAPSYPDETRCMVFAGAGSFHQ